eukprot:CAMPEP_0197576550 /NCGR_PEP_ID=MMETSP1326-20131121/1542_1 /TAXON_ID=1155430 /ORGANISM="Genus nov. species nov., Strain RCC2288" /LENGTH=264 /DNA_ID=CAMNT_0043139499 /DNA_START=20 /DNA_END=814 /DNA_ORIENTATION=+
MAAAVEAEDAPVLRPQAILTAISGQQGLRVKAEATLGEFEDIFIHLTEVAGVLEESGASSAAIKAKVAELLTVRRGHKAHIDALGEMERTYACTLDRTDFAVVLKTRAAALTAAIPADDTSIMAEFDKAVDAAKRKGGHGGAAEEDEDVVLTTQGGAGGNNLAPNHKCPITAVPIEDLTEPVMDQKGIVYEKAAVVSFIKKKQGEVMCPQHGTSHKITLNDLKPARHIERAKKRAKITQQQQQAGGGGSQRPKGEDDVNLLSPN